MRWWKKRIEASEDLRLSENTAKVTCVIRNVRENVAIVEVSVEVEIDGQLEK